MKELKIRQWIRQGDIKLEKTHKKYYDTKRYRPSKDGKVIALGEEPGHMHWVDADHPALYDLPDGNKLLVIEETALLIHSGPDREPVFTAEEAQKKDLHVALRVPPGTYLIGQETEYDPFSKQAMIVED